MTLLPAPQKLIQRDTGASYDPSQPCSNPSCKNLGGHKHHIVRRSATGGPTDWVNIGGVVVGNLARLCWQCHNEVTDNRVKIVWLNTGDERGFFWGDDGQLLNPHPPTDGTWTPTQLVIKSPDEESPCKRCHGSGKEPSRENPEWTEKEGDKPKSVLGIRIPKAELAWGYIALTEMIRQAGNNLVELGFDEKTPPYYIISAVLFDWNEGRKGEPDRTSPSTNLPELLE